MGKFSKKFLGKSPLKQGIIADTVQKVRDGQLNTEDGVVKDDTNTMAAEAAKTTQLDNIENTLTELNENFNTLPPSEQPFIRIK